jgi:hypothetical protein
LKAADLHERHAATPEFRLRSSTRLLTKKKRRRKPKEENDN